MPFARRGGAHSRFRTLRAWRAPARPRRAERLGQRFCLSTIRQPDALWVARLARAACPFPTTRLARFICARPTRSCRWQSTCLTHDTCPSIPTPIPHRWRRCMPPALTDPWDAAAIAAICWPRRAPLPIRNQDGFVLARVAGGEAEILTLAVAPASARRRGLGRAPCCKRPSRRRKPGRRGDVPGSRRRQSGGAGALCRAWVCQGGDAQGYYASRRCVGAQASAARRNSPNLLPAKAEDCP